MLTSLIGVLIVLIALIIVVWVVKEVLAYFGAPRVVWVIVSAIATLVSLVYIAQLLGAPLGLR